MAYSDLLKDPRWQKKRLQILERDNFTCQDCGSTTKTLHVHHRYYDGKLKPWEYEDHTLITFCVDCHQEEEERFDDCKNLLMDLREFGLTGKDVDAIRLSAFLQRFEQYDQEGELFEAIGTVLENRDLQDSVIKLVQEFRHQKNLKYA